MYRNVAETIRIFVMAMALLSNCYLSASAESQRTSRMGIVEVRLWSQATVDTNQITLGQIATITGVGEDVAALGALRIAESVVGRGNLVIRAWQIANQIAKAGFDPVNIEITGAARCKVNIVKKAKQVSEVGNDEGTLKVQSRVAPRASLEAKIRRMICEHLQKYTVHGAHRLKIKFNPVVRDLLALSEPAYQFEISPQKRRPRWIGLVALKVRVFQKGELIQTVPLLVQVDLSVKVLIAKRKINSKAILSERDVEWTWKNVTQIRGKEPVDMNELAGFRSKHLIPAGTILTKDLFEPIPLVKRGQLVTVIYRNGGLEIKTVGKAMETGCRGEIIPVRNERSKNVFRAKVLSTGKVLVSSSSVGVSSSGYNLTVGSEK